MARLVVVDATEWVLDMLADALREAGHEVTTCGTGDAAVAAVRAEKPDCLVCEVELPDRDGPWVVKRIRALPPPVNGTPVLFVSSQVTSEARVAALRAGADAYVAKPYLASEVLQQVEALLRMSARLGKSRVVASSRPPGDGPTSAIAGAVAEVSVSTLLAIFEVERRTGSFDVERDGARMHLGLTRGMVTEASLDGDVAAPLDAVRAMIAVDGGRFTFTPRPEVAADAALRGYPVGALVASAERPQHEPIDVAEEAADSVQEIEVDDIVEEDGAIDVEPDLTSYRPPS